MMSQECMLVASWDAPRWAEESTYDEAAVIHTRHMGELSGLEGSDRLAVVMIQRDELSLSGRMAEYIRGPAAVLIGGVRASIEQSQQVLKMLSAVQPLIEPPVHDLGDSSD